LLAELTVLLAKTGVLLTETLHLATKGGNLATQFVDQLNRLAIHLSASSAAAGKLLWLFIDGGGAPGQLPIPLNTYPRGAWERVRDERHNRGSA
jgi:hypothetical protein